MKTGDFLLAAIQLLTITLAFALPGCSGGKSNAKAEVPPTPVVEQEMDMNNFTVPHAESFPLAKAVEYKAPSSLDVTGVVNPDIARAVPVISLAAGRVVEIKARLGDEVKKGQVLLRVRSNDVSGTYQFYLKAANDERLARAQYERAEILYDKGAIAKSTLEQAEDAAKDAKVDLDTATEQLKLMGLDKDHPSGTVDVVAPISGVITDQQVTFAAGAQGLPGPNPFTISDLSYVWILCDVYENDLDAAKVGQLADIRLNAYPDKVLKGRIDNIFPILDPNLRTSKVRIEVPNPGRILRVGMFVTATFYGRQPQTHASVPATSILHLHDRDWVYVVLGAGHFKRVPIVAGNLLPNNQQEVASGVEPGTPIIQNALIFQNTVEQ
jgi:cobalt-zinc-cadmium efflux system membrane fusion protein